MRVDDVLARRAPVEVPVALRGSVQRDHGGAHRVRDVPLAELTSDIGPMRAMAGASYPTPLVDPKRTNDELGITLTPVRAGVEKTVAWLHAQRKI